MILRIGVRGSKLALAYAERVCNELSCDTKIEIIKTDGDLFPDTPIHEIGGKGVFCNAIEYALAQDIIDVAVHSLKDMPGDVEHPDLHICAVLERNRPHDVLIGNVFDGFTLGTSSPRRKAQLEELYANQNIQIKPIRGNIDTRLTKLDSGEYDAIVLAQAGISRLGVDINFTPLSVDDFSPSPGQGAIAIVARTDDTQTIEMLKKIEDADSRLEIEAERALSDYIDSGCRFPLGAYAKSDGNEMKLTVYAFSVDGKQSLQVTKSGDKNNPKLLGKQVGEELRSKGINDLALNWREKVEEWNKT